VRPQLSNGLEKPANTRDSDVTRDDPGLRKFRGLLVDSGDGWRLISQTRARGLMVKAQLGRHRGGARVSASEPSNRDFPSLDELIPRVDAAGITTADRAVVRAMIDVGRPSATRDSGPRRPSTP
jgi:hypothetical protein